MKKIFLLITAAAVAAVVISCSKKEALDMSQGVITFTTGEVAVNGTPAAVGMSIKNKDEIKTGDKSIAVIQFGQMALITIKSNSKLRADNIVTKKDAEQIELSQSEGSSFSKIVKKGTDYKISTPTAVASVRGTSFELSTSGEKSKIIMLTGNVKIAPVIDGKVDMDKAVSINAGQTIESTKEKFSAPEKISVADKEKLEQFDKITLVPDVETVIIKKPQAQIDSKELKEMDKASTIVMPENLVTVIVKIEEKDQMAKEEIQMPMTIDELSKKYGQLSIVKLKDGKQYIGAFSQKGNRMEIITLGGTIMLDPVKVEKISRFKQ
jgi:hypothetical protein